MLHPIVFNDEIKVWWEYNKLSEGESYSVYFDGNLVANVITTNYSFKHLSPLTSYRVKVMLGSKLIGEETIKTLKQKNMIDVTKAPYFAVGDGKTFCTESIQKALDDCTENDCIYFPKGTYLTTALDLHSDTELFLDDEATIQGSKKASDYLPMVWSRFEGIEHYCYRSLLNCGKLDYKSGYNCKNIVIRGGSILGGGNDLRLDTLEYDKERIKENYVSEDDKTLPAREKRGRLLQASNTQNLIIADCTIGNGPAWNLHFIYSNNITTCGCRVVSKGVSNGDGWDPDSSSDCIIFDTIFETGDDGVAVKSGKNPQGNVINIPTKNVKAFDIETLAGWGVAIGSEASGGVSDFECWNFKAEKIFGGIGIKTTDERGGYIRNVSFKNCTVAQLSINQHYYGNDGKAAAPTKAKMSNFSFEDIKITGLLYYWDERREYVNAISVRGSEDPKFHAENISFKNITMPKRMFLPTQSIYVDCVDNISFENIKSL